MIYILIQGAQFMKKKTVIYTLLTLLLTYLLLYFIVPRLGRPGPEGWNYTRTKHLMNWKKGVSYYIQNHNKIPQSLYEVYQYCNAVKAGINLEIIVFPNYKKELSLLINEKICENKIVFNEKIEYELAVKNNNWYVQEKRVMPRFFKGLWMIDQDGKIYELKEIERDE